MTKTCCVISYCGVKISENIEKSVSMKIFKSYHKSRYVVALSHQKIHSIFILLFSERFVAKKPVMITEMTQSHA
jgi:hypothetical protein